MRLNACLAIAAVAAILLASVPARAQMTAEQVGTAVAGTFGVEVLRVTPADDDGRAVYHVTFMSPGGDFDGAFQVTTIAVDAATGTVISQFRHLASGYRLSGAPSYDGDISRPDAPTRGVVWR